MARTKLDTGLLTKIASRLGKTEQYVREQISRRASRHNIASEAAQVLWAKELGFGTATMQRGLDAHIQQQIIAVASVETRSNGRRPTPGREAAVRRASTTEMLSAAIDLLLSDSE